MPLEEFIASVSELDARSDDNFRHYYVDTESLKALATFENRGYLAVGLKGVGKSGAFKYLTEIEQSADLCVGISIANLDIQLTKTNQNCLKVSKICRRNIALYILSQVLEKKTLRKKVRDDYFQNAKVLVADVRSKLKNFLTRGGGFSILGSGLSITAATKAERDEFRALGDGNEAELLLKDICNNGLKIRVVIDDPDRLLSPGTEIDSQLVAGICLASFELSKSTPNLKIVVLLKSHVFGQIKKIDEMNNIPSDAVTTLHWRREELRDVFIRRAEHTHLSLDSIFIEATYQPNDLECDLYKLSRNGARDCLRRVELCLKSERRRKVGKRELGSTLLDYAARCRDQMVAVYGDEYPGIFEFVEAIFSGGSRDRFSHVDLQKRHQNLMLTEERLFELFKQPWARQWARFRDALIESGAIAFLDTEKLILPYEERYYSNDAATLYEYGVVPAFAPLIQDVGRSRGPESAPRSSAGRRAKEAH